MKKQLLPPTLFAIVMYVWLPRVSETAYLPALPNMVLDFQASANLLELTITIYLVVFSITTLFWGYLTDRFGRRPILLVSLVIFILGCIVCWWSHSIEYFFLGRILQACGASAGPVLSQSTARDCFHGAARNKAYSTVGMWMGLAPAIGPFFGGFIDQYWGWTHIFSLIALASFVFLLYVYLRIAETRPLAAKGAHITPWRAYRILLTDKRLVGMGLLVGAPLGGGLAFSAEGPFYYIQIYGLDTATYGVIVASLTFFLAVGSFLSRSMHSKQFTTEAIINIATKLNIAASCILLTLTLLQVLTPAQAWLSLIIVSMLMMAIFLSMGMIIPNAIASATENYPHIAGAISSVFTSFFYLCAMVFSGTMSLLHNGTIYPLPIVIALSALVLYMTNRYCVQPKISSIE